MNVHTPTPWDSRRATVPTDGEYDCAISAVIDGRAYCIGETVGRCAVDIRLPAEANAAFIVKAVNNHDALVKALEGALVVLESQPRPTAGLVSNHVQTAFDKRVAAVREALAKVQS